MNRNMHSWLIRYLRDFVQNDVDLEYAYADHICLEQELLESDEYMDGVTNELSVELERILGALTILRAAYMCTDTRAEGSELSHKERMQTVHEAIGKYLGEDK